MEDGKSNDNVVNRRLKNRERQRRYRARKRQEADSTKTVSTIQQPQAITVAQEAEIAGVQNQPTRVLVNDMSRTYCKRDWKKDARLAHLSKQPTSCSANSSNSPAGLSHQSEAPHLLLQLGGASPFGSEFPVENPSSQDNDKAETKTSAPIHRDWKAEARNKCK
ncbi:hypothetical protein QQ045_002489 [Rhodiola kirilowii]